MRGGRELRSDEVIALTTLNCCANAILDNLPQLEKRLKGAGKGRLFGMAKGASKALAKLVQTVIEESGDPDQQTMIIRRMRGLHLQFGYVRKHPDDLVMMSRDDAETLLAPVLEKENKALLHDLRLADRIDCDFCKHQNGPCTHEDCDKCSAPCPCGSCRKNSNYVWRGVCEANSK